MKDLRADQALNRYFRGDFPYNEPLFACMLLCNQQHLNAWRVPFNLSSSPSAE